MKEQAKKPVKLHIKNYKKSLKVEKPSIYNQFSLSNEDVRLQSVSKDIKKKINIESHNSTERLQILENCQLLWNIRKELLLYPSGGKQKNLMKFVKQYVLKKEPKT